MTNIPKELIPVQALLPKPMMELFDKFVFTAGMSMMELSDEGVEMPDSLPIESWAAGILIARGLALSFGPECTCDTCMAEWVAEVLGDED